MRNIKFGLSLFFCWFGVFMTLAFVCYAINPATLTRTAICIWSAFAIALAVWLHSDDEKGVE